MMAIKMSTSVLLIAVINLFTLQQCLSMDIKLNGEEEQNLKSQLVDTNCQAERDCAQFHGGDVKHVECTERKCVCKDKDSKIISCLPRDQKLSNEIGMKCPCLIKYSECKNDRCMCKTNFTASDDNKHCIPVTSQLDEHCEIDLNCQRAQPYTICSIAKQCDCGEGFIKENGTCFSTLVKMEQKRKYCIINANCLNITSDSACITSKCVCKQGFVASRNENKCLPVLTFGETCENGLQCKYHLGDGGECVHEKCTCRSGYKEIHVNGNHTSAQCIREIAFGIDCSTPVDCILHTEEPGKSPMVCKNNTCTCRDGFALTDGKICNEIDAVGAATKNKINSYYFVLLFATIFIYLC